MSDDSIHILLKPVCVPKITVVQYYSYRQFYMNTLICKFFYSNNGCPIDEGQKARPDTFFLPFFLTHFFFLWTPFCRSAPFLFHHSFGALIIIPREVEIYSPASSNRKCGSSMYGGRSTYLSNSSSPAEKSTASTS